jgi:hypothetical protein
MNSFVTALGLSFFAAATSLAGVHVTIVGLVVKADGKTAAPGETVEACSTEQQGANGTDTSHAPDANYRVRTTEVSDRVTGMFVRCSNASEVAKPVWVPFSGPPAEAPEYRAPEKLVLLPIQPDKGKSLTEEDARRTLTALKLDFALQVKSGKLPREQADRVLAKESAAILEQVPALGKREKIREEATAEVLREMTSARWQSHGSAGTPEKNYVGDLDVSIPAVGRSEATAVRRIEPAVPSIDRLNPNRDFGPRGVNAADGAPGRVK